MQLFRSVQESEDMDKDYFTLRPSKDIILIVIISLLFWTVIITLMTRFSNDTATIATFFIMLSSIVISILRILYTIKCRIIVKGNHITVQNLFRKTQKLQLGDISTVKERRGEIVIYQNEKKLFKVPTALDGFQLFYDKLYEAGKMELSDS